MGEKLANLCLVTPTTLQWHISISEIYQPSQSSVDISSGPGNVKTKSKVRRDENVTEKQSAKKQVRAEGNGVGKGPLAKDTSNIVDVLIKAKVWLSEHEKQSSKQHTHLVSVMLNLWLHSECEMV